MPPGHHFARWAWLLLLGWIAGLTVPLCVHAGTEEFSTFGVESQEEDDESLLDRFQMRSPREWRAEWERSPQAFRTSQGCLTSGQWFIANDLKLDSPAGDHARFGIGLQQSESDVASYQFIDFTFKVQTRYGQPGVMYRPLFDKSRQDFAFTWDIGADTTAFQLQAVFGLEDVFNNLWAWRQTRVGDSSEPYEKRPYEPALHIVHRGERWRTEAFVKYLTPSRKRLIGPVVDDPGSTYSLWGTLARAAFELQAFGVDWELRGFNQQARSSQRFQDRLRGDQDDFRRMWSVETSARRRMLAPLHVEARYVYQARHQHYIRGFTPGRFDAIDRMTAIDAAYDVTPRLRAHFGGIYNRITVVENGLTRQISYGTRNESRLYVGLTARFGRVVVHAVEGFEIDPEPYPVWGWHDKGFLSLQTHF